MEKNGSSKKIVKKLYINSEQKNQNKKKYFLSDCHDSFENNNNLVKKKTIDNIKEEDLVNENINVLQQLQDELGLSFKYRKLFLDNLCNISQSVKLDIIIQEKKNLHNFENSLIDIKKEIITRENNLKLLKKIIRLQKIVLIKKN